MLPQVVAGVKRGTAAAMELQNSERELRDFRAPIRSEVLMNTTPTPPRTTLRLSVLTMFLVAAMSIGCGRETPEESAAADTTGTWITGEPREPITEVNSGHTVIVSVSESDLAIPTEVAPGPTIFAITNAGNEPHSLIVTGNGIESELPNPIPAGGTEGLDVTLTAGSYQAWCPVEGHRERGETGEFTVVR